MNTGSSQGKEQRAIAGLRRYFGHLRDRRQQAKTDYPLLTIIAVVLLGTLAGNEGWDEIAEWAKLNAKKIGAVLDLGARGDTPCETTLARVFARLEPNAFRDAFFAWAKALNQAQREQTGGSATSPGSIAIDGKALRRALKRAGAATPMMLVSAFATDNHLVLGAVHTEDKSNEITAIPVLLDLLDLEGALVTIDAAGTQTENTDKIVAKKGDYLVALKGNQGSTHQAVGQFLLDAEQEGFESTKSWFQNRTEQRKETQALQGERSKTGWMPVENARRRRAQRICRAATGGFESSSKHREWTTEEDGHGPPRTQARGGREAPRRPVEG